VVPLSGVRSAQLVIAVGDYRNVLAFCLIDFSRNALRFRTLEALAKLFLWGLEGNPKKD
jgi:hypothetical protein